MWKSLKHIFEFYVNGFREMTLGKTLWMLILLKLFIMFFILKMFFFPNFLSSPEIDADKDEYVSDELIHRANEK